MSFHHHHHDKHKHHHHHGQQQQQMQQYGASYEAPQPSANGAGNYPPQANYGSSYSAAAYQPDPRMEAASNQAYYANEHKHKRNEHMGEIGALAAGAFALYEHHQVKVDPAHAGRHRIEETMAGAVATGLGGYALHEHHQIHNGHKQDKHHKKHGFFR